jgi:hypothetical protein
LSSGGAGLARAVHTGRVLLDDGPVGSDGRLLAPALLSGGLIVGQPDSLRDRFILPGQLDRRAPVLAGRVLRQPGPVGGQRQLVCMRLF